MDTKLANLLTLAELEALTGLGLTALLTLDHTRVTHQEAFLLDGGGITGQAQALRMAIARALCENNIEDRPALKKEGFLMRDPRMVERKKAGQPKARKRFQFSKR